MSNDEVMRPDHYIGNNGLEAIETLRAFSTSDEFVAHCRLSAITYLLRAGKKKSENETANEAMIRDARKAARYLDWLVEALHDRIMLPPTRSLP